MDGTLVDKQSLVDENIFELIDYFYERGIYFFVASGRRYESIKKIFKNYKDKMGIIAENGTVITYKGEKIFIDGMDRDIALKIVEELLKDKNSMVLISGEDMGYTNSKILVEKISGSPFFYDVSYLEDLLSYDKEIVKLCVMNHVCNKYEYAEHIRQLFGDYVEVALSGNNCIDIMKKGTNKGTAIRHIQDILNVKKSETMVFGDNYNDIEMFSEAGMPFVMKNAEEAVKKYAKYETEKTNDEGGVVYELKKYFSDFNEVKKWKL